MASSPRPRLAVLGAGFLGRFVADEARRGGWEVLPVVRSEGSAAALRPEYPAVRAMDAVEHGFWSSHAPQCEGMVWAIAPSRGSSEEEFKRVHSDGAVRAAEWAGKRKIPFVYISSTSVYAEELGGWVDEDSVLATDPRAAAMTGAERACRAARGTVLRCAGLYGGGRILAAEGGGPERWLNLVHVQDVARAVGMALRYRNRVLNVCEDEPRRRGQPGGSWPEGGRRVRRNKRVRNARLRALGWFPGATLADQKLPPS